MNAVEAMSEVRDGLREFAQSGIGAYLSHPPLTALAIAVFGLWGMDARQLQLQVEGILRLPDIRYVELREATDRTAPRAS
jgi:Periplasmic sensor domain found in signal transduction proteins